MLTWVSGGTFSGSINTQNEYTGTADALLTDAAYVTATLLPAGYESYAFLSIEDETDCSGWVGMDLSKAFAPTKKAAVEQFSYERAASYSSGFALSPDNAIVSFTISGLAANKEVAVLFKEAYDTGATPVNVTTDASGVATFAVAVYYNDNIDYYTLTVDGIDITLPAKTAEKGHIYNISRSVPPAVPEGAINGQFSVSDTKKVYFSKGNLQATYNTSWSWAFATNQWDYIGNAAGNTSINGGGTISGTGTVDLFGWVGAACAWTGAAQYGISNVTAYAQYGNVVGEALKSDWGTLAISNGGNTANFGWHSLASTMHIALPILTMSSLPLTGRLSWRLTALYSFRPPATETVQRSAMLVIGETTGQVHPTQNLKRTPSALALHLPDLWGTLRAPCATEVTPCAWCTTPISTRDTPPVQ